MLLAAATMEAVGDPVETDTPVRQMLERAGHLVRAAGALGDQENPTALSVLSRAILENLIVLLWVQVAEENPEFLKQSASTELARSARINFEKGKARVVNRLTGEDVTAEFLRSDLFKDLGKRASVQNRAREAGVEDLYTVFYRFMSLDTHGIDFMQGKNLAGVYLQCVGAFAATSGHVGVRWLVHRQRTDNETLRLLLGIENPRPNASVQPSE